MKPSIIPAPVRGQDPATRGTHEDNLIVRDRTKTLGRHPEWNAINTKLASKLRSASFPEKAIDEMSDIAIRRILLGHANGSITDRYSKLNEDVAFRKKVAEEVGLGFELPLEDWKLHPKSSICTQSELISTFA